MKKVVTGILLLCALLVGCTQQQGWIVDKQYEGPELEYKKGKTTCTGSGKNKTCKTKAGKIKMEPAEYTFVLSTCRSSMSGCPTWEVQVTEDQYNAYQVGDKFGG
jgi:hypothetical protein